MSARSGFAPLLALPSLAGMMAWAGISAAGPQTPADSWVIESYQHSEDLGPGIRAITIDNPFGEVRIRPSGSRSLELRGTVQRHVDDPDRVVVDARPEGSSVSIRVRYPGKARGQLPSDWRKRRIDLTIRMPAELMLDLETRDDLAETKGISGAVRARSETGDVIVFTAADSVDVFSGHGAVHVLLRSRSWKSGPFVSTRTGSVLLQMLPSTDAEVLLETKGEISTDYSIEIDRAPGSRLKRGRAVLGEGGDLVSVVSESGAIRLLEAPLTD